MNVFRKNLAAPSILILAACSSSGGTAPPSAPVPAEAERTPAATTPTAPAGAATFTDAQADRGRDIFRAQCTECHYSSEFSDSQFQFKWSRRTAGSLYQLIHTQMPETAPGSLAPQEAADIVAYILRMNGFEPGSSDLAPDRTVLDAISLASIRN